MKESAVKDRILEVASRLFYTQGYNLTGINQIIEEADIARASLYNHFPSKTDLLIAYLMQTEERWYIDFETFTKKITDPREKLLALFDFKIMRQKRNQFGGCHFLNISAEVSKEEKRVADMVVANKERLRNYINALVIQVKHKQILTDELLTDTIFLLLEGCTTSASIYKSDKFIQNAKKAADRLV